MAKGKRLAVGLAVCAAAAFAAGAAVANDIAKYDKNMWGMMSLARAFGGAVRKALGL